MTKHETPAQRDARVGVITQAMADDVDGVRRVTGPHGFASELTANEIAALIEKI